MFASKNSGGWALALVALGLFIGLVMRDVVRKDNPPESTPMIAMMVPPQEEHAPNVDDLTALFERVATQCAPFVVTLQIPSTHRLSSVTPLNSFSGVLMSPDGFILTNAQLVQEVTQLAVTLSNKKIFVGEVLGSDVLTGVAVVKIAAKGLKGVRQGNSDNLRPGQWVVSLGNAAVDRHAVSAGIISVKGRANAWLAEEEDFLQTDAVINSNTVGGALVDLQSRLVGINLLRGSSPNHNGMSRAIPINMAREVMRRIVAEGKFVRGALEAQMQELDANLAQGLRLPETSGVLISEVVPEGAAARAGLQRGDVIMKWGEKKVVNMLMLRELVALTKPGATIPITVIREGMEQKLEVTLAEARNAQIHATTATAAPIATPANKFGLVLHALTSAKLRELQLPLNTNGVVVVEVMRGSAGELAGIQAGDIIQEWDRKSVMSIKDLRARMAAAQSEQTVLLFLRRGQQSIYCALEVAAAHAATENAL